MQVEPWRFLTELTRFTTIQECIKLPFPPGIKLLRKKIKWGRKEGEGKEKKRRGRQEEKGREREEREGMEEGKGMARQEGKEGKEKREGKREKIHYFTHLIQFK